MNAVTIDDWCFKTIKSEFRWINCPFYSHTLLKSEKKWKKGLHIRKVRSNGLYNEHNVVFKKNNVSSFYAIKG